MALSRQHKLIIILLVFYWAALFILAHIPIPQLVRKADVSDKALHFLAYMILAFLLFSAINPYKKVSLRPRVFLSKTRAGVWWVLLVMVWYGIIDEVLQGYVAGRSCDIKDFVANLAGTLTGLIMLSVFTFWGVFLVVTGVTIFGLSNIARANLADLLPGTNIAFHLFAYVLFTLLWIRYLYYSLRIMAPKPKWLIVASILPIGLLLAVKLGSLILGRSFAITDVIVSIVGIVAVMGIIFFVALFRRRLTKTERVSSTNG